MTAISYRITQGKGLFRETAEPLRPDRRILKVHGPTNSSAWKSPGQSSGFDRDEVIHRLEQLPPNVILTDFDQTITAVTSNRDYYEEFKKVRANKNPLSLKKDIVQLAVLRVWSKKFPSQFNKLAFYRFLLPGLNIDNIVQRHEINPNFIKVVQIIEQYGSDYVFGICSVGIGQIVEKTVEKIGLKGYGLMLNIYEEEKGMLTGKLMNDYLFTEEDKKKFPRNRIILGDDRDQKRLYKWPLFVNINMPGFEKRVSDALNQKVIEQPISSPKGLPQKKIFEIVNRIDRRPLLRIPLPKQGIIG